MIKALLFDCGGVMQAPLAGEWIISPGYDTILGYKFSKPQMEAFNAFIEADPGLLPEAQLLAGEAEEETAYKALYAAAFQAMGLDVTGEQIAAMGRDSVYRDDRNFNYDDVLPWLDTWHRVYRIGLISDATPSSKRMIHNTGIGAYLDSETYSYELGITKPSAEIFERALSALGFPAEEVLFVDDNAGNLAAAGALGMNCVQMQRLSGSPPTAVWDGPVVHDMQELDEHIARCNRHERK